ncbi:hypothetical protein RRG08_064475 [Elysia crispata]|uniref:Uncharacterized protein n=1 Tax=Elysia crispata TaxID=231223 RepID=A0AAE1AFC0_9GAST|nr:hypothetical protein RRG08_064475 [Elysia crispata]
MAYGPNKPKRCEGNSACSLSALWETLIEPFIVTCLLFIAQTKAVKTVLENSQQLFSAVGNGRNLINHTIEIVFEPRACRSTWCSHG